MKTPLLLSILIGTLLLTACGAAPVAPTPDVGFIQTSAANTVVARFTLTASAPTFTPLAALATTAPAPLETATATTPGAATDTPVPGTTGTAVFCNYFGYDNATVDVTIPDGTQMVPGQAFVKTWRIKNIGTCTWGAGYKPFMSYGNLPGTPVPLNGVVGPGQEIEISVQFKAPAKAGDYTSCWAMNDASGQHFFGTSTDRKYIQKPICIKIVVKL